MMARQRIDRATCVVTGNGPFRAHQRGRDYSDTVLKLRVERNRLELEDYFTPVDQEHLNSSDGDLGSGGPLLLPEHANGNPSGIILGGKAGVVNPQHMGDLKLRSGARAEKVRLSNGIYSAPSYWNSHLYYYASGTR